MERVRKKDVRHLNGGKHAAGSSAPEMTISEYKFKMIAIPPDIPATAWLGVERMKHLLDLKNADLIVSKRDRERRINFAKDVLDTLGSILPEVACAVGRRRNFSKDETLVIISAMASILQSYADNM